MPVAFGSWRRALAVGAVAGVITLYLIAVGIVLAFAERNLITGFVTLGRVMLSIPPLAAGYMIAGRPGPVASRLAAGLLAGAVSGLILAPALVFADAVPQVRDILLRISPKVIAFISFDHPAAF